MKDRRDDPRPIRFTLTTPVATYAIAVPSKHARKGLPGYPLVPIELLEGGSAEIPQRKDAHDE